MSIAASTGGMRHDMDAAMMASRKNAASVTPMQMKKIRQTAQDFEAVFIGEMLRPMFANIDPEGPFGGGAGADVWKDMQVDEFGKAIAKNGGIGLADSIVRAMLQMQEKKVMEAEKRIGDLITITTRLIDILERENAMLRERHYNDLNKILDEKATIGRVYEARVLGFSENRSDLDSVDPAFREQLTELAHKVDALMAENTLMLQVAVTASRRVVDLIAEAVKDTAPSAGTYSARGRKEQAVPNGGNMSLSLNQTL